MEDCLFCKWKEEKEKNVLENELAFARYDEFAVSKGHILFMTKRHVRDFFETTDEEKKAIFELVDKAKAMIDEKYHPDGYNIGMNCGEAAGQSVMHVHVHLIPRYYGDVENPKGGIRGVIPKNQSYDKNKKEGEKKMDENVKFKQTEKQENSKEKGITLIVLIITIIILIILAAISINAAVNIGILGFATNGAERYKLAEKEEKTTLNNLLDMWTIDGKGDQKNITPTLDPTQEISPTSAPTNEPSPTLEPTQEPTPTPDPTPEPKPGFRLAGQESEIKVKGTSARALASSYGNSVDKSFYSSNEGTDFTWQLFYDDDTYIYLIASDYAPTEKLPLNGNTINGVIYGTNDLLKTTSANRTATFTSGYSDYVLSSANTDYQKGASATSIKSNRLTSTYLKWVSHKSSYSKSTDVNMKSVAYMMDTNKWKMFVDSRYENAQAIGGPTIELFAASYNYSPSQKRTTYLGSYDKLVDEGSNTNVTISGYLVKAGKDSWNTSSSSIGSKTDMWCIHEVGNAYGMWLASPSSYTDRSKNPIRWGYYLLAVYSTGIIGQADAKYASYGFRPLVSIPKADIPYNE